MMKISVPLRAGFITITWIAAQYGVIMTVAINTYVYILALAKRWLMMASVNDSHSGPIKIIFIQTICSALPEYYNWIQCEFQISHGQWLMSAHKSH